MNKPNFVCGPHNVTIEHPETREREFIVRENIDNTLSGRIVGDTLGRKFKYTLGWRALNKAEFTTLMIALEYHIDSRVPVTFTYPKWSSTASGVDCLMRMAEHSPIGSGESNYMVEFDLELTEMDSRI